MIIFVSCKTSTISLPQGTSETAEITSNELAVPKDDSSVATSDDWLKTDEDFAIPDPKTPEEIATYEAARGESAEEKALREEKELLAKMEAERQEAERIKAQKAKEEAEQKAKLKAKQDAEKKALEEKIAAQKLEEEKKAKAEEERKAKAEQREAERLAAKQAEDERKAKAAAARKAEEDRREAERLAAKQAEEERKAREKAEAAAKAEAKLNREKEDRAAALAKAEAERKAKEDEQKAESERILAEAAARRAALERQAAIDAAKVTPAIEEAPYTVETYDETPSRSVRALVNQYIDVSYPGAGWVYLGEVDESQNLISFANRELDNSDTSFTLRAIQSGTAVLHFYKQDVLTGTYIDDFLEVIVLPQQYKGTEHQVAPLYSEIVPPNQRKYTAGRKNNMRTESAQSLQNAVVEKPENQKQSDSYYEDLPQIEAEDSKVASTQSERAINRTIQINESAPESKPIDKKENKIEPSTSLPANINEYTASQLLETAKKLFEDKKYDDSLSLLNLFFEKAVAQLDEGWYLKGQLYESPKASFRNIRTARDSYQALVDRYPSSVLWQKANNRILYIDRYYFKIR